MGKKSEINGIPISNERIEREIARYRPALRIHDEMLEGRIGVWQLRIYANTDSDQHSTLPEGVVISTPLQSPRPLFAEINTSFIRTVPFSEQLWITAHNQTPTFSIRFEPFAWAKTLDWNMLPQLTSTDNQLINLSKVDLTRLNAMIYPAQQDVTQLANRKSVVPRYLIYALLNNTKLTRTGSLEDIHHWLRSIPQSVVLQFFAAIPKQVMAVLKERIFAAALDDGDGDTVQLMLTLGVNPLEMIPTVDEGPAQPLGRSVRLCKYAVTKIIISHLCRTESGLGPSGTLKQLLKCISYGVKDFEITKWAEIVCIPLLAGAELDIECFKILGKNFSLTKFLLENSQGDIQMWVRTGLLTRYIEWFIKNDCHLLQLMHVLTHCLHKKGHLISPDDPEIESELCRAFFTTMQSPSLIYATQIIFEGISKLKIQIRIPRVSQVLIHSILEACRKGDWDLVYELSSDQSQISPKNPHVNSIVDDCQEPLDAASRNSLEYTEGRPSELSRDGDFYSRQRIPENAARYGHDKIDVGSRIHPDPRALLSYEDVLGLLQDCKVTAVVTLLESDSQWKIALQNAYDYGNYNDLEDLLFRTQEREPNPFFPTTSNLRLTGSIQLAMRMLSYHAIQNNNINLMRWLVDLGLDMDEISFERNPDYSLIRRIIKLSSSQSGNLKTKGFRSPLWDDDFPSLLSIAARHNKITVIQFLLAEGAEHRDPVALEIAIRKRIDVNTIEILLNGAESRSSCKTDGYGSAALRRAIRDKNYALVRLLSGRVDSEKAVYWNPEDWEYDVFEGCLSPLGEAILGQDLEATDILLNKGVSLSALVSYSGISWEDDKGTNTIDLERLNPLLAAIEMRNMTIIEALVNKGAEIDYPPKQGLLRTPLQRAAEIGSLEIVKYLLKCGAPVDSAPFCSGGTPLQLAAMRGYVGIATLLLEHGADINHQPAKGAGRTAFELASEWGRVDMLYLLMKWGVDLDLVVGEDKSVRKKNGDGGYEIQLPGRDTQYRRALYFAKAQGQMATAQLVEHLYLESRATAEEDVGELQSGLGSGQNDCNMEEFLNFGYDCDLNSQANELEGVADGLGSFLGFNM